MTAGQQAPSETSWKTGTPSSPCCRLLPCECRRSGRSSRLGNKGTLRRVPRNSNGGPLAPLRKPLLSHTLDVGSSACLRHPPGEPEGTLRKADQGGHQHHESGHSRLFAAAMAPPPALRFIRCFTGATLWARGALEGRDTTMTRGGGVGDRDGEGRCAA